MSRRTAPSNTDKVVDSRDIIERIAELRAEADDAIEADAMDEDDYTELLGLEAFAAEAERITSEWNDGATLISEDHFEAYAEELAEDIGAIDRNAKWPLSHIDWEAAAEELKQDYSTIDWDGNTYYVRDC